MPSNPKRHGPARTANGPTAPDTTTPTQTTPPEQPKAAPSPPSASAPSAQPSSPPAPAPAPPPQPQRLNITDLKDMSIQKLTQVAKDLNVGGATGMRKQELIFQILKAQTEQSGFIFSEGVLEV